MISTLPTIWLTGSTISHGWYTILVGLIEHSGPCLSWQNCHSIGPLEVIQEAQQGQIQVEFATARTHEGTAKKELNSPKSQLLSINHICQVKVFESNACVFLGRNCCHIRREIPTIDFIFLQLKRVATDSLHSCAQVALEFQSTPCSHMLTTPFHEMIKQDTVKLFN